MTDRRIGRKLTGSVAQPVDVLAINWAPASTAARRTANRIRPAGYKIDGQLMLVHGSDKKESWRRDPCSAVQRIVAMCHQRHIAAQSDHGWMLSRATNGPDR
jgi:hypothetical protein